MKIGFFSETYSPEVNGVVTSINTFRDELERLGHTVYVFAPGEELFSLPRRIRRERRVYRFNSFSYPSYKSIRVAIPFNWPVQRQIPKLKLDVVHSHTPFSMGLFASAVARQYKLPHVHTYHTLYPEYVKFYFPGFKKWNEKAAEKFSALFCNQVTEVVAPSDGIRRKLRQYGVTTPITTLPTGVRSEFFGARDTDHATRRRYGIPERAPLLITVSRLGQEKSIDYLLRSFRLLLEHQPDAWYLIVGDGPARHGLETLAHELGIAHRVIFSGLVKKPAEVTAAYAAADLFVFASKTDTQCLTLLEAAATGLPLVARFDTPLKTALHDKRNGLFVRGDEARFAVATARLLANRSEYRRFGQASVSVARSQSAALRADELVTLYKRATKLEAAKLAGKNNFFEKIGLGGK